MTEGTAADHLPERRTLGSLRDAVQDCRGCELYRDATQAVFGDGAQDATVVFVGEQPGDEEDQRGEPFVGPAGRELDRGLEAAGIPRDEVWITNVVKHFRFETKGRKRLHQSPTREQIASCRPWLDAELEVLGARIVVALGASAAKSLLGSGFRVTRQRGEFHLGPRGTLLTATMHPSSILRAPSDEERHDAREAFADDLRGVAAVIDGGLVAGLALRTRDELYQRAQELDLSGRSSMSKQELAETIAETLASA